MNFIIVFIALSLFNVVFSTIRTITTVKSGKGVASLISGGYFAFYNIMIVYTVMDFPMWQKCLITFCCNVLGVYIVKMMEEKSKKEKLWKIEFTTKDAEVDYVKLDNTLTKIGVPHSYVKAGKHTIFNCYCATKSETALVKNLIKENNGKYFASETTLC